MPGFRASRSPHNKGLRYPADPPKVEEIIAVGTGWDPVADRPAHSRGARPGRARSRSTPRRRAHSARQGSRRREVGLDAWGRKELQPWLDLRLELSVGPLFCVINGPTRGRHWSSAAARADLRRTALKELVSRRRFAPTSLGTPMPSSSRVEGVPLIVIQSQRGQSNLGITSVYLQGIDNAEIIETVHARRQPMIPLPTPLKTARLALLVAEVLLRPARAPVLA